VILVRIAYALALDLPRVRFLYQTHMIIGI